ncbi:NodT family efflux transporter outer membrane factor (OMF) lipoprotein [Neolewinella xylanilytica]|uniref:NodT family efflux transporter outer membrane factor (OMF) lipoprotein n=1 Tax=Neolewinella xylanilytica TaxID=1514080 RepID=A0A2S6I6V4_9BACT|nr:TolC family protein [Neolewinella xylanilytica]PPK87233.1 NodT family efflux transporter outer membrane factor (OMF) lipoprotein [Neolewinella xylanilytica]
MIPTCCNYPAGLVAVVSLLFIASCSVPQVVTRAAEVPIPDTFPAATADTTEIAAGRRWDDFFTDPYLLGLIDTALVNNKEVNILLQRIAVARNEIQARKGEYLPTVNAGLGTEVEKVGRYTRNGALEESLEINEDRAFPEFLTNIQFGLYASWELDVWKQLRNARKVAVLEYLATVEGRNFLITNLVAEIADSYFELLALDSELDNIERNIAIQEDALRVVNLMQQAGRSNTLAVRRFEAEVQKNRSETYRVRQDIAAVENRINFLTGRLPGPVARTSDDFLALQPVSVATGIPSQLLRNRPDIRQAELEMAAADLDVDVARANFLPSFGIRAGLGYQAFNLRYLLKTPESLLLSLAGDAMAPLVNRNAIEAEYQNAGARQVQAAYEYEQTVLDAYREVATEISNIDKLADAYRLKEEQVAMLDEAIEVSNKLFQSTRAEYLEVLLTQRDALEARTDLIETRKEQLAATVNLYQALGGGWK